MAAHVQPISAESIWTNYSLMVTTFLEIYFLLFFLLSSNIHVGNMEIFAVVIVFCSALCHLVHAFYNRSTPFLLSLLAAICKINLLKFYDLKLKGNGGY